MPVDFHPRALTIVCSDLDASLRFYREGLGAKPLAGDGALPTMHLQLGPLRLALLPNADAPKAPDPAWPEQPGFALWLEVDDLEAAHAQALAAGGQTLTPSDGDHVEIADPDGNPIEVWRREG